MKTRQLFHTCIGMQNPTNDFKGPYIEKENLGERGNRIFADYGPDMPRDTRLNDGSPHSHNIGNLCGQKGCL